MGDAFATLGEAAKSKLANGEGAWLTSEAVYDYYRERDAHPLAPVVLAWHIQNDADHFDTKLIADPSNPSQKIPVVSKRSIDAFIQNREKAPPDPPETEVSVSSDPPDLPATRTLTVAEAYKLYQTHVSEPMSISWFRSRLADGTINAVKADEQRVAGRAVWLVDAESLNDFIQRPGSLTMPRTRWFTIPEAYKAGRRHKIIPPDMSLNAFRQLVYTGEIEAERTSQSKRAPYRLTRQAMENYFLDRPDSGSLEVHEAYEIYCTQVDDPVSSAEFWRYVDWGEIPSHSTHGVTMVARKDLMGWISESNPQEPKAKPPKAKPPKVAWMTPTEVADLLRVEEQDVYDAFEAGDLPGKKIGKKIRFDKNAVLKFLET